MYLPIKAWFVLILLAVATSVAGSQLPISPDLSLPLICVKG